MYAVLGVLAAACAPGSASAALLSAPAIVPSAPAAVAPLGVLSPRLSPVAAVMPVLAAPLLTVPLSAPIPAAPVPVAASPLAVLRQVAAKLGDAALPGNSSANGSALSSFWNGEAANGDSPAAAPRVVDAIVSGGASPEFVARVKAHLRASVPEPILRDMLRSEERRVGKECRL